MKKLKLLRLGRIYKVGTRRWKVGAVMNPGERYYLLVNAKDSNDVAFYPASWIETIAVPVKEGKKP